MELPFHHGPWQAAPECTPHRRSKGSWVPERLSLLYICSFLYRFRDSQVSKQGIRCYVMSNFPRRFSGHVKIDKQNALTIVSRCPQSQLTLTFLHSLLLLEVLAGGQIPHGCTRVVPLKLRTIFFFFSWSQNSASVITPDAVLSLTQVSGSASSSPDHGWHTEHCVFFCP